MSITIVGIAGSLRRQSFNRRLLEAAAHELAPGVEIRIWYGLAQVPPFSEGQRGRPCPRKRCGSCVRSSPRRTPSSSRRRSTTDRSPGQLKNALDWASRPRGSAVLAGKPVATVSASPTPYGAAWAQAELRRVLKVIGADLIGEQLPLPHAFRQFDDEGRLIDRELASRLARSLAALAARCGGPAEAVA